MALEEKMVDKEDVVILIGFLIGIKVVDPLQTEAIHIIVNSLPSDITLKKALEECLHENLYKYNLSKEHVNSLDSFQPSLAKAIILPNLELILEEARIFYQLLNISSFEDSILH